ncbi:MAG: response regulator transcription factor [Lewinellaceae bacterium]|nr:response regulator transcription factor [Phaeodactylibacter sp.]MCB9350797.1 response regulator transcription factor [Lewinellaceae bacterium]
MKAILVDDERYCTELLSALLAKNCPEVEVVAEFNDPQKAAEFIRENPPDLLFLDIEMPRLNGFDLLERVRPVTFQVVFTTAYNQYALRAIKISALDYLLKPIDIDELKIAVEKARQQHSPQWGQFELMERTRAAGGQPPKTIALSTLEGLHFVEVADIVYCQSEGSYTNLFFMDGQSMLLSKPIKDVGELLIPAGFLRVHNSYLINLSHIKKYIRGEGGEIIMKNGHTVPVSRSKKAEFLERIARL